MMNASPFGFSLGLLWIVHFAAMVAVAIGIFFLLYWAIKTFTVTQLKTWGIGLTVVGIIVCLLTLAGASHSGRLGRMGNGQLGSVNMMYRTFDTDDSNVSSIGMMGGKGLSMTMMMNSLQGKTGDAFDAAFLQMMIPHHQGAIDMAKAAQTSAKHDEIKRMANDIITSQQREIDQMKQWQATWGYQQ